MKFPEDTEFSSVYVSDVREDNDDYILLYCWFKSVINVLRPHFNNYAIVSVVCTVVLITVSNRRILSVLKAHSGIMLR